MSDAHKPRGRVKWGYLNTSRPLSNKGKRVTEEEAKKREAEVLARKRGSRSTKNVPPHGHITIGEPDHGHEEDDGPKPNVPSKPSDRAYDTRCPDWFQFPGGQACGPKPVDANPLDDEGNPAPARKTDPEAKKTPQQQGAERSAAKREAERLLMKALLAEGTALADKIEASGFKSLDSEEKALYQKLKGKLYNNDAARIREAMGTFFVYQIKCQSGRFPPSCNRTNIQVFDDDQLDKWQDKSGWVIDTTHASASDIPVDIRTYYMPTSKKVPGYIDWNRYGQPGEPSPGPLGKGIEGPYQHGYSRAGVHFSHYYKEGWPSAVEWEGSDHWLSYREMDIDVALASLGNEDIDATMKAEGWFTEVPKVAALIELVEEDEKATQDEDEDSTETVHEDEYCGSFLSRKPCPPDPTTPAAAIPIPETLKKHPHPGRDERASKAYINSLRISCESSGPRADGVSREEICEIYEKALATRDEPPFEPCGVAPGVDECEEDNPPPPQSPAINVVPVPNNEGTGTERCGGDNLARRNSYVEVGKDFRAWARAVGAVEANNWLREQSALCLSPRDFMGPGLGGQGSAKYKIAT
jgi:hypothetical protein